MKILPILSVTPRFISSPITSVQCQIWSENGNNLFFLAPKQRHKISLLSVPMTPGKFTQSYLGNVMIHRTRVGKKNFEGSVKQNKSDCSGARRLLPFLWWTSEL